MVKRDGFVVMLSQAPDPAVIVPLYKHVECMWNIYFWVDDVDALYADLKKSGAKIDYELCDQPTAAANLEFRIWMGTTWRSGRT